MINKTLEINTVAVCKCLCNYCPQKSLQKGYTQLGKKEDFNNPTKMSWDTYISCLNKVPKDVCIDFAGFVEPFHSDTCVDMMLHAHDKGYRLRLFTTLSGLKREDVYKIANIPWLDVCYHVPDNLHILKVEVNQDYLATVSAFLDVMKCSAHCFGPIHEKLKWVQDKMYVEDKELTERHLINRGGLVKTTQVFQVREVKKTGKLWCKSPYMMFGAGAPLNFNVMDIYGNVYLCCCCFGLEHKLGNLLIDTYDSLFQSEEYHRVVNGLNGDESIDILCRTCDMSVEVN